MVVRRSPLFSELATVVRTSGIGVQVVGRLDGYVYGGKHGVGRFYADPAVVAELRKVGAELLEIIRAALGDSGGEVDESGWQSERLCRLPGWRVSEKTGGAPELASLWWAASQGPDGGHF